MSDDLDHLRQECEDLRLELVQKTSAIEVFKFELEKANQTLIKLKTRLDHDYKSLSELFRLIVPTKIPKISGFQFSTQYKSGTDFYGDYFDVFEHKDKLKFGTLLCKSPSPSVSAVVLALLLKLSHEFEEKAGIDPSDSLNQLLSELKDFEVLPDLFLGYFNKRDFSFTYSGRGEIIGLIKSHKDRSVTCFYDGQEDLKTAKLKLDAGDVVVLLTKGFFKSANENGDFLATEEIISALHALSADANVHDLRHEILFVLDKHLKGKPPAHDTTLVIFSPDEPVLRLA
jgi:phosphoserine phosphatase RsbU/P